LLVIILVLVQVSLTVATRHGQRYKVPDFKSMTMAEAKRTAARNDLRLEVIDSIYVSGMTRGAIIEQYPKAGNVVKSGRRIFLTTNTHKPKMVPIPYVTGFSLRQAKNKLIGAGLIIDRLNYKNDLATNNVLDQTYRGNKIVPGKSTMAEVGTGVTLTVGRNPVDPDPYVPDLIGLTVDAARNKIWESGFNVGEITYDQGRGTKPTAARVYSQSVPHNSPAMYGRTISLKASTDNAKVDKIVEQKKAEAQNKNADKKQ
ncbi:MAG: PASTA domain-containing protein, partial [Rikenellaceae bacterium]|nr:PASTA domain-containing protein [Rikenellaceae bacterium]